MYEDAGFSGRILLNEVRKNEKGRMYRPHLKWSDYDNEGNVLPMGYKRLRDGTIVNTNCMEENAKKKGGKEE